MVPGGFNEDPAAMRRENLLREAQLARLAAEAAAASGGRWNAALLKTADLVLYAGHRLHVYAAHRRLAHVYDALLGQGAGVCLHIQPHHHPRQHGAVFPPCVIPQDV